MLSWATDNKFYVSTTSFLDWRVEIKSTRLFHSIHIRSDLFDEEAAKQATVGSYKTVRNKAQTTHTLLHTLACATHSCITTTGHHSHARAHTTQHVQAVESVADVQSKKADLIAKITEATHLRTQYDDQHDENDYIKLCLQNKYKLIALKSELFQDLLELSRSVESAIKKLKPINAGRQRYAKKIRMPADDAPVHFGKCFGQDLNDVLGGLHDFSDGVPLKVHQIAMVLLAMEETRVVLLKDVPSLAGVDSSDWVGSDFNKLRIQLLSMTRVMVVKRGEQGNERCVVLNHNDGCSELASVFEKSAQLAINGVDAQPTKKRKSGSGRPSVTKLFPTLIPHLQEFVDAQSAHAQERRRDTTARLITPEDGKAEGFRMGDAQQHLFEKIPGLYEHGCDLRTLHRLFVPPRRGTVAESRYSGIINAKLGAKRNDREERTEFHVFSRSQVIILLYTTTTTTTTMTTTTTTTITTITTTTTTTTTTILLLPLLRYYYYYYY